MTTAVEGVTPADDPHSAHQTVPSSLSANTRRPGFKSKTPGKGIPLLANLAAREADFKARRKKVQPKETQNADFKPWWGWLSVVAMLFLAGLGRRINRDLSHRNRSHAPLAVPRFLHPEDWERRKSRETSFENERAAQSLSDSDSGESLETLSRRESFPRQGGKVVWSVAEPLPQPMTPAAAFYRNGRVYVADPHGTLCAAKITSEGRLCPWGVRMGRLPARAGACAIAVLDNYLVSQTRDRFQIARIDENGVGEWSEAGRVPGIGGRASLVGKGNRLYLAGGAGGRGNLPLVRSIDFDERGRIEAIDTQPPLPRGIAEGSLAVAENRIYWVGGREETAWTGTVFSAPLSENGDLGEWEAEPSLASGLRRPNLQVWDRSLWVVGGGNARNRVFVSSLTPTGRLCEWSEIESDLPDPVEEGACLRAGGRFLLLGGKTSGMTPYPNREVYWWRPEQA